MKINQMKKDEYFEGFYLIKRAEVRKTRAGKDYIAFTFQDDSGEISGNLWDAQPYNVEEFTAGKVVHILVYYFCRRKGFMLRSYVNPHSLTLFVVRRILLLPGHQHCLHY